MKNEMIDTSKSLIEKLRFYLKDGNDVGKALLLIKNTKKVLDEYEDKIKTRGIEIMDKDGLGELSYKVTDELTGEMREFQVKQVQPTEVDTYSAESVIEVVGFEHAIEMLKVSTAKVNTFIAKSLRNGNMKQKDIDIINKTKTSKARRGYVVMRELKPTKR